MITAPEALPAVHRVAETVINETHATWVDGVAVAIFLIIWRVYPYAMRALSRRFGSINLDMAHIRATWMRGMSRRPEARLLDANLIGHTLSTASFFASTNLILLAAVGGALFGGERAYRSIEDVPIMSHAPHLFFMAKLGLILVCLAGGLMDFIWSIRQLNYSLALTGAAPYQGDLDQLDAFAGAASQIFEGALNSFNSGVRGYYFAAVAGVWLVGPIAFAVASLSVAALLIWRQLASPAAKGIQEARRLLDHMEHASVPPYAETPVGSGHTTPVPPMPQ